MTRADVEDFLYAEAALLDEWKLRDWLALWTEDASYVVPATDAPDGDPRSTLCLIADDLALLRARVDQLLDGAAWAESPRSRTQRMIANVRIVERSSDAITATSSFVLHRFRHERSDSFVGWYRHDLRISGEALRIQRKRITLAHHDLFAQGKISVLL
jgi:p-cumate 2,3-dioxygenase beta subunit